MLNDDFFPLSKLSAIRIIKGIKWKSMRNGKVFWKRPCVSCIVSLKWEEKVPQGFFS